MNSSFFNSFIDIPNEIVKEFILPQLSHNDFLKLSATNKKIRTLMDEFLKTEKSKNQLSVKAKLLILWFFNPDIIQNTGDYTDRLKCLIKNETLNFWHKALAYHLLSSLKSTEDNTFLNLLNKCDIQLLDTLEKIRLHLIPGKNNPNQNETLIEHVEQLFFNGRADYIKVFLATCLATLGKVNVISDEQLNEIIKLGMEYLNSEHSVSAAILLNHLAIIQPLESHELILKELKKRLVKIDDIEDAIINIKMILSMKDIILKASSADKKYISEHIYKYITSETLSSVSEILLSSLEMLKVLSEFIDDDKFLNVKDILFAKLKLIENNELVPSINDSLVFIFGKLGSISIDKISEIIESNDFSLEYEMFISAKTFADCIYLNNFHTEEIIQYFVKYLGASNGNSFIYMLGINLLSSCMTILSKEHRHFLLNCLLEHTGSPSEMTTIIETLQKIQPHVHNNEDLDKIINCLLNFTSHTDDYISAKAIGALGEYAHVFSNEQSQDFSNYLFNRLFETEDEMVLENCMKTVEKFLSFLTFTQQLKLLSFFDKKLDHYDLEIVLTAIDGLKMFVNACNEDNILDIINRLEILEANAKNDQISASCFSTINAYLSKISEEKLFNILISAYGQLETRNTERLLNFVENCGNVLKKRSAKLYENWINFIALPTEKKSNYLLKNSL